MKHVDLSQKAEKRWCVYVSSSFCMVSFNHHTWFRQSRRLR